MLPKKIHYCWFGGNKLPDLAIKCCDFVKEAYQAKRWAFVSDYARLKVVYDNGGIYLDTDVELVKSLDILLQEKCYFGEETTGYVNTGLGFGAEKHSPIIDLLLKEYYNKHFINDDGSYNMDPCPKINTKPLLQFGYSFSGNKYGDVMILQYIHPSIFVH